MEAKPRELQEFAPSAWLKSTRGWEQERRNDDSDEETDSDQEAEGEAD